MNTGDTAWLLACAALVMLMTPGLAFFYAGMVRAKSVLTMLMMNVICLVVVGLVWAVVGFDLAFGSDGFHGLIGGVSAPGAHWSVGALAGSGEHTVPLLAFAMFQLMFAVITPALISGAVAERTRFWPWLVFVALWSVLVYAPVAHWVFAVDGVVAPDAIGGWIANRLHALDFAGGTAVHMNAGAAALALAIVLGRRTGWPEAIARPHNLPFTVLGAALLWFGWYGFNAGSALSANGLAAMAFANTTVATCAAVLAWLVVEQLRTGSPTTLGAASGAVAGLVAITPACGYVGLWGAIAIGVAAGVICPLACALKWRLRLDDSLDVVAIHLVGGLVGTLLVGVFATSAVNPGIPTEGLLYGGGWTQLGRQAVAAGVVACYSFVVTLVLGYLIRATIGFRAGREAEHGGLDLSEHAETGYDITAGRGGTGPERTPPAGLPMPRRAPEHLDRRSVPVPRNEHP
ncbi:ammonium transporter [Pseudonocardia oroxyli]|uniref:Ammonium transporter n=1 Tax=Pseudonocardia oroxyli TaxID=366584 RepID=A0A1G7DTM6_PSEOR|nr:ammonium transporter [Pseudonocardia oroxyli]SDE54844.1 ammonium transporter [Pseudonocardia oroxyli]